MSPVQFYKCLADETRLRCLLLLEHETELRKCGLLSDRRQGQWVFYRINPALPAWTKAVLTETLKANKEFLGENLKQLSRMGGRPERAKACC